MRWLLAEMPDLLGLMQGLMPDWDHGSAGMRAWRFARAAACEADLQADTPGSSAAAHAMPAHHTAR
jgi:hypothetical protein